MTDDYQTPDTKQWDPTVFLRPKASRQPGKSGRFEHVPGETALVILNTPISRRDIFTTIWENASIRYCADGGANRLLDGFGKEDAYIPDLIKGDFDSLRDDTRKYYESKGVPFIQDRDQYATDLGKCIKSLVEVEQREKKQYQLVIYGGLSGRFDQTAHTIHALYPLRKERAWTWVVSEDSLTCLLDKGKHELHMPKDLMGPTCGILPIGVDSVYLTTKGLEWDLDHTESSFETMVSTSNHLIEESVLVETTRTVVWTAELRTSS